MSFGSLPSVLGNGGGVAISVIGGTGLFADGTAAAPSISFASDSDTGIYRYSAGAVGMSLNGANQYIFGTDGGTTSRLFGSSTGTGYLAIYNTGVIGLTAGISGGANQNVFLAPSGTGLIQFASGGSVSSYIGAYTGNPAVHALYIGVTPSNSNYSLFGDGTSTLINTPSAGGKISLNIFNTEVARFNPNGRVLLGTTTDSGALLQIGTNTTTSAGGMVFGTDTFLFRRAAYALQLEGAGSNTSLILSQNGVLKAGFTSFGSTLFVDTIAAGDAIILRSGAQVTALTLDASQNANFAGHVFASAASSVGINGRSVMRSSADGIMRLTNFGDTDFTRLQFGGTTASFPALQRVSAALACVLANDSAFATFRASDFSAQSAATVVGANQISYGGTTATTVGAAGGASALPATPLGYIIVNVAGTAAKIPYYNS